MIDYDSPWKETMDRYLAWFLAFFFPKVYPLLDWSREYEPLDTELRKIIPDAKHGKRHIDRLVKSFHRETGDPRLVHVEMQVTVETDFERRMHVYNYRIEDVYSHPVLTLVVLGDESPDWRPGEYHYHEAGCERLLRFPHVKLLDYANKLDQLEHDDNPIALLVVAHLMAQQTRGDDPARKDVKLRLLRNVQKRKMDAEDKRQWTRFLDWFLPLPKEVEKEVTQVLDAEKKENEMPYVTSWERMGYDRGIEEGFTNGEKKGLEKGLEKGILLAIETALELKFAAEGLALMAEIQSRHDTAILRQLLDCVKRAISLDDVRAELARSNPTTNGTATSA
jgi:hypothetical protein